MKKEDIIKLHAQFEKIVHTAQETGIEFWLLVLMLVGISFFSYVNYQKQPKLWHGHINLLKEV